MAILTPEADAGVSVVCKHHLLLDGRKVAIRNLAGFFVDIKFR